jgi:hypothetical protein
MTYAIVLNFVGLRVILLYKFTACKDVGVLIQAFILLHMSYRFIQVYTESNMYSIILGWRILGASPDGFPDGAPNGQEFNCFISCSVLLSMLLSRSLFMLVRLVLSFSITPFRSPAVANVKRSLLTAGLFRFCFRKVCSSQTSL